MKKALFNKKKNKFIGINPMKRQGKKIPLNKKSQIGATLSWFVATLIIFFIIVLFLSASIIFSGNKKITSGSDKINLEKKIIELSSMDVLSSFLEKKIIFDNEKTSIKNIIAKGLDKEKRIMLKEKLKEELDKIAKENDSKFINSVNEGQNENACYLFDIKYSNLNLNVENGFEVCSFTCNDERFDEYVDQYKNRLLAKSMSFDLYSEKGIIKTKFYLGAC